MGRSMKVDAVSHGLQGMERAHDRLESSARRVVNDPENVRYADEVVEQRLASAQAEASARVVATALDLEGSLVDILA